MANAGPNPFDRSIAIDGCVITKPATRRLRPFSLNGEASAPGNGKLVYVGNNPVIKKTAKMLRKTSSGNLKKQKVAAKRATPQSKQTSRAQSLTNRSLCRTLSHPPTNNPKVPRRKPSDPFLTDSCGDSNDGSVTGLGQMPSSPTIMTRSRSRQKLQVTLSLDAPRTFSRQTRVDKDTAKASNAPSMPKRKASNPFLKGYNNGLVSHAPSSPTIMTRSRSRQKLHTNVNLYLNAPGTTNAPSIPMRKGSNPFLRGENNGLVGYRHTQNIPIPISSTIMTRSRSKQKLQGLLSLGAPKAPSRKASIPDGMDTQQASLSLCNFQNQDRKVSFMDLQWSKMTLADASPSQNNAFAPPKYPTRKGSVMDLDAIDN